MQRRRLLATVGLALGTAGCLGIDDGDDATTTTTAGITTTTATTTASATLDVTEVTLQQSLVLLETDYLRTFGRDARYLLANCTVSDGRVDRSDLALRVDGRVHTPGDDRRASHLWRVYQSGNAFEPALGGLLLFELPASGFDSTSDAAVTWPGGEHRLRAGLRERLGVDAPELSASIDAPDSLVQGESPTFAVAVTNEGDVPGRFVAGLNRYGPRVASTPAKRFSVLADAGATERTSYTGGISGHRVPDEDLDDGEPDLRYGWNGADDDRTFPIEYLAADE